MSQLQHLCCCGYDESFSGRLLGILPALGLLICNLNATEVTGSSALTVSKLQRLMPMTVVRA